MKEKISELLDNYVGGYFKKKDKETLLLALLGLLNGGLAKPSAEELNLKEEKDKKEAEMKQKKRSRAAKTAVVAEVTTDEFGRAKTVFRRHESR